MGYNKVKIYSYGSHQHPFCGKKIKSMTYCVASPGPEFIIYNKISNGRFLFYECKAYVMYEYLNKGDTTRAYFLEVRMARIHEA